MATTYAQPLFGLGTVPKKQLDLSQVAQMPVNAGMTGQAAILDRLNPLLQQQRSAQETQWTNQGLRPGGAAYDNAANLLGQQENDARTQAILQGLNLDMSANNQGFGQALQSGEFENNAAGQGFNQNLARDQFGYQQFADQRGIDAAESNSKMSGLFGLGQSVGVPLAQKAATSGLTKLFGLGAKPLATAAANGVGAGLSTAGAVGGGIGSAGIGGIGGGGVAPAVLAPAGAAGSGGLLGTLGALATNPFTIAAAGAIGVGLLAKKFFGNGADRQAANDLTGNGGVHQFFNEATQQINQMPDGPEKQQALDARDREFEKQLIAASKIDKDHYYQAQKTLRQFAGYTSVKPLLG